jgi:hypothetical protein
LGGILIKEGHHHLRRLWKTKPIRAKIPV